MERYNDYLNVILEEGDLAKGVEVVTAILDGLSSIIETSNDGDVLEAVDGLIRNAQV